MDVRREPDREAWRGLVDGGGFAPLPRWTLEPRPGVAEHVAPIPPDELVSLGRLCGELGLPVSSVFLAAHATVLAALSGEGEVVTGYAAGAGLPPVPVRLSTEPVSWRALVQATSRVEADLRTRLGAASGPFSVDDVRRELGLAGPGFETVLDAGGGDRKLADATVLEVALLLQGERPALRLRYRTDALDDEAAARIAGYHLTALARMAADPGAEHGRGSLLSAAELHLQLHGLAGPRRDLPDRRMHELFEQRVATHPDAPAAVHRDRQWTYRELNARANRIARALLARDLQREAVVAVVMERNLDWLASVLAIWKAGLAYLPLEPHFPAGRIDAAITRAECALVLTERGSTGTLDQALEARPEVTAVLVEALCAEDHDEENLGVPVAGDQLAYVLFTSGSTGQPKGAMLEHAGMLNHLYAKVEDLGVRQGEVIAQTAPQCFDISVWQLVTALLVGGRTVLVEQDVILDAERFVDTLVDERVGVLQVVPSYLDVVVTYLEQRPRELTDLHCVSPTGDLLKKELVQRWFGAQPKVPLVNAYGLTETSDDALHEVIDRVPDGDRVPVGRPIINTCVDIVDENLAPVPLGAPGVIAFSGVCVGRGYVNDPERTSQMFRPDPNRPGRRICWTGDYGRWRPDGKIDFLGRRDNQVKIRGFRIEIGEVENALLGVPGVRDGAVVVAHGADQTKHLVAFYSGSAPLEGDLFRAALRERLPEYMLPSACEWQATLPLTANGKVDRKVLIRRAVELAQAEDGYSAPVTPTEQRLAGAWATVLGVPADRIGRQDSFFALGGTSLSAVKLAVALDRAVALKDIVGTPVLADLADLVDGSRDRATGPSPSTPATEPDRVADPAPSAG